VHRNQQRHPDSASIISDYTSINNRLAREHGGTDLAHPPDCRRHRPVGHARRHPSGPRLRRSAAADRHVERLRRNREDQRPAAKADDGGRSGGEDAAVGDITYYAPWGNLAIFYQGSGYANGLVKLGSIESGVEALANQQGSFTATIDRAD
jgi:hypothetical protein